VATMVTLVTVIGPSTKVLHITVYVDTNKLVSSMAAISKLKVFSTEVNNRQWHRNFTHCWQCWRCWKRWSHFSRLY